MDEYHGLIDKFKPVAIIINYHELTMTWFSGCEKDNDIVYYVLHHEGTEHSNLNPDYYLYVDSTFRDVDNRFAVPRPLFETVPHGPAHDVPVISSFGFGFGNKGFGRIVKTVNDQFDEAIIRLHIPFAHYGDMDKQSIKNIYPGCYAEVKKTGIKLEITNDFYTDEQLLNFLSESTLNIFLYDEMLGRGLSSVIDYGLSVNVPLAISQSYMFRHIKMTQPSICYEDRTLPEIIASGPEILQPLRDQWSQANFIAKYEQILNNTL